MEKGKSEGKECCQVKLIVVDPGHGGKDSGAVTRRLREKDLVLALSRKVGERLQEAGFAVRYTREGDTYVSLSARAALANQLQADAFLSIHCNAGGGTGFESYIHPAALERTEIIQEEVHRRVAAVFRAEGLPDRGKKRANLAVLRETAMPALLLECGFIDHPRDAALIQNGAFQERIAQAVAEGLVQVFQLGGDLGSMEGSREEKGGASIDPVWAAPDACIKSL